MSRRTGRFSFWGSDLFRDGCDRICGARSHTSRFLTDSTEHNRIRAHLIDFNIKKIRHEICFIFRSQPNRTMKDAMKLKYAALAAVAIVLAAAGAQSAHAGAINWNFNALNGSPAQPGKSLLTQETYTQDGVTLTATSTRYTCLLSTAILSDGQRQAFDHVR